MRNGDEVGIICCLKFFVPQAKPADVKMGNSLSGKSEFNSPISTPQHQLHLPVELPRTHSVRASIRTTNVPMPDKSELERRFTKVLVCYIVLINLNLFELTYTILLFTYHRLNYNNFFLGCKNRG